MRVKLSTSLKTYAPGFDPSLVGQTVRVTMTAKETEFPAVADSDIVREQENGLRYIVYNVKGKANNGAIVCFDHVVPLPVDQQVGEHRQSKWVHGTEYYFWRPVFGILFEGRDTEYGVDIDDLAKIPCRIKLGQYEKGNEIRFNIGGIWADRCEIVDLDDDDCRCSAWRRRR